MSKVKISIIVPTYNNAATLQACLASIRHQHYPVHELIVVDNHSTDNTLAIAREFTSHVYTKGPERSAQRNYGVSKATGDWVTIIDSDMELTPEVIKQCTETVQAEPDLRALIIPEESFGIGFWARCKQLERSFYVGNDDIEAARFFDRAMYQKLGGYDEQLVSGEDWDLSQRFGAQAPIGRIGAFIRHNEGHLKLRRTLDKKYYYAKQFAKYTHKQANKTKAAKQTSIMGRYGLFLGRPRQLFQNPAVGAGMLFMKTCEFAWGAVGYISAKKESE